MLLAPCVLCVYGFVTRRAVPSLMRVIILYRLTVMKMSCIFRGKWATVERQIERESEPTIQSKFSHTGISTFLNWITCS